MVRGKGKIIVNEGVDIDLPRINVSSNYDKHLFSLSSLKHTVMIDDSREKNVWRLVIKNLVTDETISCYFKDKIVIGRGKPREGMRYFLRVRSTGLSHVARIQCIISIHEGNPYIEDCLTVNGTFVNGKKVDQKMRLPMKCRLGLADEEFQMCLIKS